MQYQPAYKSGWSCFMRVRVGSSLIKFLIIKVLRRAKAKEVERIGVSNENNDQTAAQSIDELRVMSLRSEFLLRFKKRSKVCAEKNSLKKLRIEPSIGASEYL